MCQLFVKYITSDMKMVRWIPGQFKDIIHQRLPEIRPEIKRMITSEIKKFSFLCLKLRFYFVHLSWVLKLCALELHCAYL